MAKSFALRFISGKYQGGEFPLMPNREIVVGRSSDLDMVLVEDMVSRKHAKISTHEGQLVIQDLGSTNGTFVNGEKIKKTRLKEGDRVLIGTSILKVVTVSDGASTSEDEAKRQLAAKAREKGAENRSAMSGSLEEVPVPTLLQLFSTSKRTGVLNIRAPQGVGKLFLRNGDVFYASINDDHDIGPKKAFFRIVGWTSGQFEFARPDTEPTQFVLELEDSTEELLMEATRQLDEFNRIQAELPKPNQDLRIPVPLEPPLTSLQPTELEVLQLVHNHGRCQAVFDASAATDFETATALLTLLRERYVVA